MLLPINISLQIQIYSHSLCWEPRPLTGCAGSNRLHICHGQPEFIYRSCSPRQNVNYS